MKKKYRIFKSTLDHAGQCTRAQLADSALMRLVVKKKSVSECIVSRMGSEWEQVGGGVRRRERVRVVCKGVKWRWW